MNFVKQIERLILLNRLISQQNTGSPEDIAQRLNVSVRQVYNLLEMIRDLGIEVCYCKKSKTYYYENSDKLHIDFSLKIISDNEREQIFGGYDKFSTNCNFFSCSHNTLELSYNF
jgi:transcriptional antiterminator